MTFLNPFVLFGLIAATIPLVLHLLNLRRLRTVEFSSLRFLKELQRSSLRRVRIRQWVLLLLRTLLIASLVFAFSRPAVVGTLGGIAGGRAATTMVVLVDDSPSMTVRNERGMLFAQAKESAASLSSLLKEGDQLYLVPLSELVHKEEFIPLRTREQATPVLSDLQPSLIRVPFQRAFRAASRILATSNSPNQEVYLLTDAQANQFLPDSAKPSTAISFTPQVRTYVIRTGATTRTNAAVASAEVRNLIVSRSRPLQVGATLRNFGAISINGVIASMTLDGTRIAQQSVNLSEDGSVDIIGRTNPRRAGFLKGSVDIEDDALDADNHRYFSARIPGTINVLLVGSTAADTRFVRLALTLSGDSTLAGIFTLRQLPETALPASDLGGIDVIILCNVRDFNSVSADRLIHFVEQGGGLMIFPGVKTDLGSYNSLLFSRLGIPPAGAPAGTLNATPSATGVTSFGRLDQEHPLFSGMFEDRAGHKKWTIASPHISTAIVPGASPQAHAIISLTNGRAFLMEYPAHQGRVLLYAVDAGIEWSDFATQGLFAPLVYRSAVYLSAHSQDISSFVAGQPLEILLRLSIVGDHSAYFFVSPSGKPERTVPEYRSVSGIAVFRSTPTIESGIYELQKMADQQTGQQGSQSMVTLAAAAVNVDTAESDLRTVDEAALQRFWTGLGIPETNAHVLNASQTLDAAVEQSRYGLELWKHFLFLALALALAEMIVAREARKNAVQP